MCAHVGSKLTEAARDLWANKYVASDSFSPFYTFYSNLNFIHPVPRVIRQIQGQMKGTFQMKSVADFNF